MSGEWTRQRERIATLPCDGGFAYTFKDKDVYVNLFLGGHVTIENVLQENWSAGIQEVVIE